MKIWNLGVATAVVAALATPSFALADKPADPGAGGKAKQERPAGAPGADAGKSANKGNAYGKQCKTFSKKKVDGAKHSPFVQCVKALKLLDAKPSTSPAKACKDVSKKKVKGEKGTPFSRCVVLAAKAKNDAPAETDPAPAPATDPAAPAPAPAA